MAPWVPFSTWIKNRGLMTKYQSKSKKFYKKKESVPPVIKQYVNKAIMAKVPTKKANYQGDLFVQPYNTLTSAGTWYVENVNAVCPYGGVMNIGQGVGQSDRIGNRIMTKSNKLKYVLTANPYNATSNLAPQPYDVKIWILVPKSDETTLPAQSTFGNFFNNGDTSQQMQSNLYDMVLDVNSDLFEVLLTRTHKVGYQADSGTGSVAGNQSFSNNDYKLNVIGEIDLTKITPKHFLFNDAANYPQNRCIFMVTEAVPASGAFVANTQLPVSMWYSYQYEFIDA